MAAEKNQEKELKIFSLNGNIPLAEKIAEAFGTTLGKCHVRQFSDGEIAVNLEESVRGIHAYIIQSTNKPVNDYYMELMILIDAMKRASAKTVNVVLPYYAYSRQDRTASPHEPITAKLIANLLMEAGATRVLTLDLHTVQVQGFFDIPVDNLFTTPLFARYYLDRGMSGEDYVVVSPKNSGVSRSRSLADYLGTTLAIVDQGDELPNGGYVIGNVQGKKCIMVDDIINTGETLKKASELLAAAGATEIYACASHGLCSAPAKELLDDAPIKEICVTDSCLIDESRQPKQLTYLTCANLMGRAIEAIHDNQPMSPLFRLAQKN